MNWQLYTDRMNTWQALNPGATPEEREAASFAIERDVANQSSKARQRVAPCAEKRVPLAPAIGVQQAAQTSSGHA